ncbi:MAG: carboxypeptidase M32 [Planctomycetaceae bacterium]|nr:carboxypeptidase M32 [Planctomycetaceae bacterium]
MSHEQTLTRVRDHVRQTILLSAIEQALGWDERCMMPQQGGEYRAEQMTLLAGMIHERNTAPQLGEWYAELAASPLASDPHSDTGATIRELKRNYDKQVKLPKSLVEELARATVRGQQIWQEARAKNDFKSFQPVLTEIFRLKQQQAAAIGYEKDAYDALLDDYEPAAKTAEVTKVLAGLRDELVPLVAQIRDCGRAPDVSIVERRFPVDAQERFGKAAAAAIGFDFQRGRLDVTAHPFCTTLGPHDHRITTRYDEQFFNSAFFGILHEAGHGLYELGLNTAEYGFPLGAAISLGIHESQSRLWENFVGRSRAFWQHFYPAAQREFPEALAKTKLDDFHFAINDVRPSLIRVEADEATYNLHILIRFELEQAVISGQLKVADLPGAWNEKYEQALGVRPPSDADGVLQDIHWSAGLIGYFPTYSLGNLYAGQFFAQADRDLGGLDAQIARGEFTPLREWLIDRIHRHGQRYTATELVQRVTGRPLSHAPLMKHLRDKFGALYGLS